MGFHHQQHQQQTTTNTTSSITSSQLVPIRNNLTEHEAAIGGFDTVEDDEIDADLEMALRLSAEEQKNTLIESERERQLLEEVLRLSLEEK